MTKCPACGRQVDEKTGKAYFCGGCGARLPAAAAPLETNRIEPVTTTPYETTPGETPHLPPEELSPDLPTEFMPVPPKMPAAPAEPAVSRIEMAVEPPDPAKSPAAVKRVETDPAIVELTNISKWFGSKRGGTQVKVLEGLNLSISRAEAGAFLVLLGPSGCGKSTILSLISGLALADEGEVRVFGEEVTGPNPHSATVPQAYTCFPWLTVQKNVEFGLALQDNRGRQKIASDYLHKVGLGDRLNARTQQLSGGMKQRVAIARTLAIKPKIMLMDEPFGALDAQTRTEMQQVLLELWKQEKNTIIFVTHDISEALLLADRVVVFSPRPARILADWTKLDEVFGPERPPELARTKDFIERAEKLRDLLKKPPAGKQPG